MRAVMNFILCSGWSWQAHKKLLGSVVAHVSDPPHAYFHTPHPWGGNRMHGFIIAGHRIAHWECLCRIRLSLFKHQASNKQVCSGITEVSRQLRPGRVMQLGKQTVPMRAVMNFILCSGWSWQAHKKLLGSTWQTVVAHVSDSPHAYFHTPTLGVAIECMASS